LTFESALKVWRTGSGLDSMRYFLGTQPVSFLSFSTRTQGTVGSARVAQTTSPFSMLRWAMS